jgi:hypothetical protein
LTLHFVVHQRHVACGDGVAHFVEAVSGRRSTSPFTIVQNFSLFVDFIAAFFSIFVHRLIKRSGLFPN